MKTFSKFEIAAIKRTAQNVNTLVTKKNKLKEKIEALQKEYDELAATQETYEAPIKALTGFGTEELVNKVVESATDKEGKCIKIVKWVLKYPDTVIPPVEDTTIIDNESEEENVENNNINNQ